MNAHSTRDEIKDDLSRFLREAGKEEIVITRHGKPAGAY
jgi:prevent-host-death family protein